MDILVLMSTYNGEKFLDKQIESILGQEKVNIDILIRDDGSTDGTPTILKKYEKKYDNIKIILGDNIGYEKSFLYLVKESSIDYDYYAFSDQDDVWLPNKLSRAITFFDNTNICQMYWSNAMLVDEDLIKIKPFYASNYFPTYEKSTKILNSGALGCTIVFNKELKIKMSDWSSEYIYPHDFLVTTIALFMGKIYFDQNTNILYRQHMMAITGNKIGIKSKIKRLHQSFKTRKNNSYSTLAMNMLNNYWKDIKEYDLDTLKLFSNYRDSTIQKYKLLISDVHKETLIKTIALKIMIIFNLA